MRRGAEIIGKAAGKYLGGIVLGVGWAFAITNLHLAVHKSSRPTHRDKAAMNGAQTYLFAKLRRVAGSVSGPPAVHVL